MARKIEPHLEISLNWFNCWKFQWSCYKKTWQATKQKLKPTLIKFVLGAGIMVGTGLTIHGNYIPSDGGVRPPLPSIEQHWGS